MDPQTPSPPERRKTILLVDDDASILKFVSEILTHRNYEVLTAGSGPEALLLSRKSMAEIAVLLSDFQMPGMSGVELAIAITRDRPRTKVLLMSGYPEGLPALEEGWQFLEKPFMTSQLCALVSGLVCEMAAGR